MPSLPRTARLTRSHARATLAAATLLSAATPLSPLACSLSGSAKDRCLTSADCNPGNVCSSGVCIAATSSPDATVLPDAAPDTAVDAPANEAAPRDAHTDSHSAEAAADAAAPTGTVLATEPAGSLTLYGVTTDGWAVYLDVPSDSVMAVAITGGAPQTIASQVDGPNTSQWGGLNSRVQVSGADVLVWQNLTVANMTQTATLLSWNSTAGVATLTSATIVGGNAGEPLGTTTAYLGSFAVTDGTGAGAHVAFLEPTAPGASTANLKVAALDGTPIATVLTNVDASSDTTVSLGFVGAALVALTGQPTPEASARPYPLTLVTAAAPSWLATPVLTTNAVVAAGYGYLSDAVWNASGDQSTIALITDTGLNVVDVASGAIHYNDPGATLGTLNSTPSFVIFPLAPAPAVFPGPTGTAFAYVSQPDGGSSSAIAFHADGGTTSGAMAASLFAAAPSGAPVLGAMGDLSTFFFGSPPFATTIDVASGQTLWPATPPFTADGTFALFFDESDLYACPVGPAPSVTLTILSSAMPMAARVATGAKVVYSDAPQQGMPIDFIESGTANLSVVDLATSTSPRLVATQANANFAVTATKDRIVFVWGASPSESESLYVVPVL